MTERHHKIQSLHLSANLIEEGLRNLQPTDVAQTVADGQAILEMTREGVVGLRALADTYARETDDDPPASPVE